MGILTEKEYCDILYCLCKSKHVPRGMKPHLEAIIAEIVMKDTDAGE